MATTLQDAWDDYFDFSGRASDVARKLAFTGIALIWLFSGGDGDTTVRSIHGHLKWPLILIVLELLLDFLQYVYLTAAHRWFAQSEEARLKPANPDTYKDQEVDFPECFAEWGERLFFVPKIAALCVGWGWLLVSLTRLLHLL